MHSTFIKEVTPFITRVRTFLNVFRLLYCVELKLLFLKYFSLDRTSNFFLFIIRKKYRDYSWYNNNAQYWYSAVGKIYKNVYSFRCRRRKLNQKIKWHTSVFCFFFVRSKHFICLVLFDSSHARRHHVSSSWMAKTHVIRSNCLLVQRIKRRI